MSRSTKPLGKVITNQTTSGRSKLENAFMDAVILGCIDDVKNCLKKGVNPNFIGIDGLSALHIVCEVGQVNMADILINAPRIDLNLISEFGMTPLMITSFYSNRPILQKLLRRGVDPNFRNKNGNTALHYACMNTDVGIIFDLITHGARTNKLRNIFDVTPLTIAAIDKHAAVITRYLLKKGAHLDDSKEFPLLLECALACNTRQHLDIIKMLVRYDMKLDQVHPLEKRNCLHYAAITGYLPLAEYLLSEGIDSQVPDATNRSASQLAEDHKHFQMAKLIKAHRIKIRLEDLVSIQTEWDGISAYSHDEETNKKEDFRRR